MELSLKMYQIELKKNIDFCQHEILMILKRRKGLDVFFLFIVRNDSAILYLLGNLFH